VRAGFFGTASARVSALFALLLASCGGSSTVVVNEPEPIEDPVPLAPPRSEGTIVRAELDAVIAQGVGRFLQRVETVAHLDGGRFVGHRIVALRSDLFTGVDLVAGDTILRINGMPIERPEHAMAVFDALRVASELTIDLLRDGQARQLRFAIEDR
jgi:type II secretory pathway component PulC